MDVRHKNVNLTVTYGKLCTVQLFGFMSEMWNKTNIFWKTQVFSRNASGAF